MMSNQLLQENPYISLYVDSAGSIAHDPANTTVASYVMPIEPGKTYTVKLWDVDGNQVRLRLATCKMFTSATDFSPAIKSYYDDKTTTKTLTAGTDENYLIVYCLTENDFSKRCMVNYGTVALPYEKYSVFYYLIADELNFYTVTDGALKSVPIVGPLTAAQFTEHGCKTIPDGNLLLPLYNPRVYAWSERQTMAKLTAIATAAVSAQTVTTNSADMSDVSVTGIQNAVCDVSGNCLISIGWGDDATYEYFDGNLWQTAPDNTCGMTAAVLSAITTSQWADYLATKTSKQYRLRYLISQGDSLKLTKINYINGGSD